LRDAAPDEGVPENAKQLARESLETKEKQHYLWEA
jgi:hypothetical protein